MKTPTKPGWYWFLPDANCPTPTGLLRLDKPVVILVGSERNTRDGKARLVMRLPTCVMYTDEMSGDWEPIKEPKRMQRTAMERIRAKRMAIERGAKP